MTPSPYLCSILNFVYKQDIGMVSCSFVYLCCGMTPCFLFGASNNDFSTSFHNFNSWWQHCIYCYSHPDVHGYVVDRLRGSVNSPGRNTRAQRIGQHPCMAHARGSQMQHLGVVQCRLHDLSQWLAVRKQRSLDVRAHLRWNWTRSWVKKISAWTGI